MKQKKATTQKAPKKVKIKIIKPVAGVYGTSDVLGSTVLKLKSQAEEMVKSGHAQYVK